MTARRRKVAPAQKILYKSPMRFAVPSLLLAFLFAAATAHAQTGYVHLAPAHAHDLDAAVTQPRPEWQPLSVDPAVVWLQTRLSQPRNFLPVNPTDLQTVHLGGTAAQSLDIVLVGDGFADYERDAFFAAAANTSDQLLQWTPYAEYASLFNVYALFVASAQSGASHPSQNLYVDNAFGTTFDYGNVERLAVADDAKVLDAVGQALPTFDIAVVLVNDLAYGGSGGAVPVVSMAPDAISILRHELGHNLAHLADEYTSPYPGYPVGDGEPNVTAQAHLEPLKWHAWVKPETTIPTPDAEASSLYTPIGAFEGARYQTKGMFRPAPNCLMRSLDMAFCPVCQEALILAIQKSTTMLRSRLPGPSLIVTCTLGQCPTFAVDTAPIATLQLSWLRDGVEVATGASWTPGTDDVGTHTLVLRVRDATAAVRADPGHALVEEALWNLHVDATQPPPDPSLRAPDCGACETDVLNTPSPPPGAPAGGCQAGTHGAANWPALAALALWAVTRAGARAARKRRT